MALKQVEDNYNNMTPSERNAYYERHYGKPRNHQAISRLSQAIESNNYHALMSDAEWEAETIARYKRMRDGKQ
jgi:hypothetical protein